MATSLRDIVMATPRPLRKFIRYRLLPTSWAKRLGTTVDNSRDGLYLSKSKRQLRGSGRREPTVQELMDRLYHGFSEQAVRDLEELKLKPTSSPEEAAQAAQTLGTWFAYMGQWESARHNAAFARLADPATAGRPSLLNLECDALCALDRQAQARDLLAGGLKLDPENVNLHLSMANTFASPWGPLSAQDDRSRLLEINQVFSANGFAQLALIDESKPLTIDNIHCPDARPGAESADRPKVSVIICAYNAQDTLFVAVESLLRQTWTQLEIIIVDDQSPDGTYQRAKRYETDYPGRIVALQQERNSGPYPGRNLAMTRASGEFITIHDADDWSHPQKIEKQMEHLLDKPSVPANFTSWVRCLPHLYFRGTTRGGASRVGLNHSSLLLRREVVERLDGWDQVRFGADTEFNYRVEADGKIEVIPRILKEVPLAFALDLPSSLTRQDVTHVLTRFYGVRRNYHDAAWAWRNTLGEAANWRLTSHPGQRAFPAPRTMLPECPEPTEFDLMVIMDWALGGGAYVSTLNYVKAAVQSGLQVCVFHLRRYDLNVTARPHLEILKMAQEGQIYRVSPGEEVRAKTVLVGYPVILKYRFDLPPQIDCDRFCIIVNQMPNRLYSGGDPQYDPTIVTQNVKSLFGKEPVWIPISEMVRNLMKEDGRFEQVHFQTWNPLIDIKKGEAHRAVFRGHSRKKPVVGRHARDHYTKWPSSAEAIRDAYCVNQNCEVRILGGAKRALEILKQRPKNWVVEPFDNEGSGGFLEDLDFWIHYPHEDYIEEFGRAVIEAMVAGVPVILPPVFQPTFGDAAIYAEPQKVFSVVNSLFQDEAAWLGRASAGRAFVEHHNDLSRFTDRMNSLAPPPQEFTA